MSNGFNLIELLKELLSQRWAKIATTVIVLAFFVAWGIPKFIEPVFEDEDQVEIPKSELLQLRELHLHYTEEPCDEWEMSNSVGAVEHYCSDDDTATFYEWQGRVYPKIVFSPRRLAELELDEQVMSAGIFNLQGEESCDCEHLDCLDPWEHPGPFAEERYQDEENECVWWIWREFDDCCLQYQRFDECNKEWIDENPIWECCVHRLKK
jgi:hypothetical protein